jgi:hypothetical protein
MWLGAFVVTVFTSITWHAVIFEQTYLKLGVFTRMNDPIYAFGALAWVFEATAITLLFLHSSWREDGLKGALKLSFAANLYLAGSTLMGTAAKVEINDLSLFFLLAGSFLIVHSIAFGLWLHISENHLTRTS